ncbi:tRNA (adenosine(37)-N6)-threonylcarbamoyltransferase complex dimerization subunit type 1 TsaB [Sphingomonas piscis]|uniref:tRNA (Adenosine(37)-N6)-threonylcarbamoyltransferase complex dimerization subunit type 1 TsaB n=1 Tax=Sphingomonas piscis TaxID=2714943 RepID=A0A6G7YNC9_9SPHN|nr:tRNA (adenosine(37)-N6)-threonylcarbamoyltransferase complex dimerization subunit type 1 TsaB [Sphingomonas piscis]QIK78226.1 tRNA (adenosine(37)-N6)-threonylcarbamoyltransferase complex dimerization subunit type 1 TsaB [Sphingomonas piscis]
MILAIDTSSAACTAALFDGDTCIGTRDEVIGRGHSERLVPMIAELLDGRRAEQILVGVGPGSFTGIRVGIAAAHGLAIGWGAEVLGFYSLALLAASAPLPVAVAVKGGHGELFVQQYPSLSDPGELLNLTPSESGRAVSLERVIGSGAALLIEARGRGESIDALLSARHALSLPEVLRTLPPRPLYARAPDAKLPTAA